MFPYSNSIFYFLLIIIIFITKKKQYDNHFIYTAYAGGLRPFAYAIAPAVPDCNQVLTKEYLFL